jgi:Xaa-Pro aminopeptidase
VTDSLYHARRQAVAAGLAGHKLDALLIALSPNLRYLSGFTGSNAYLLVSAQRTILFTDPRYQIQARQQSAGGQGSAGVRGSAGGADACHVRVVKGPLVPAVASTIARLRWKRIGYEPSRITCDVFEALKTKLPMRATLEPVDGWIESLRMIKSPAEIDLIRRSVQTNSRAFEQAVARLRPGMTESALAAEIEYRMRRLGAEKPAFETIVASGLRTALPHAQPTSAEIGPGSLVLVDMGAQQDGYCSDMTRMLFLGKPSARVKRAYRAVLEAQLAAIDAVRPGAATARVDAAARQVLKGYGLEAAFTHSTGHGLGLEIHEPPRIGRRDKNRLEVGMAITIEPGVYIEDFGGIRIEDTVVVTPQGCEILTPTPKDLRLL